MRDSLFDTDLSILLDQHISDLMYKHLYVLISISRYVKVQSSNLIGFYLTCIVVCSIYHQESSKNASAL